MSYHRRFKHKTQLRWRYIMDTLTFKTLTDDDMRHIPHAYPNRMMGIGAWIDTRLIGWGLLTRWRDVGEISDLWVDEAYRNRGIGTNLIHHLAKMAKNRRIATLEIGVDDDNPSARRLYERLGFVFHRRIEAILYLRCPIGDIVNRLT